MAGSAAGTRLRVGESEFNTGSSDQSSVYVGAAAGTSAHVGLSDNLFNRTPNVAYTQPTVNVPAPAGSARLTAMGNRAVDKGAGSGVLFNIGKDDWHRVIGNASVGWTNEFPTPGVGVYQWN